jgi:hypothetical protein
MNINPGDTVEYIDTCSVKTDEKHSKTVKIAKQGIWDGTKVVLNDKEQTTVYNLKYLTKVKSEEEIINEAADKSTRHYCGHPPYYEHDKFAFYAGFITGIEFQKQRT